MNPVNLAPFMLFVFFFSGSKSHSLTSFPFIFHYLKTSNLPLTYFLTCWTKYENVKLIQSLKQTNIRISFPKSGNNVNYSLLEKGAVTTYGYILDLTCQKFKNSFLTQNITSHHLRMNHPWLIFTESSSLSLLKTQFKNVNLRMDSNVKLAIPKNDNESFEILDVYNPGFQIGEKPRINIYGFSNGSKLTTKDSSFYLRRKNMTSIKLRSGSVVLIGNHSGRFEEYMSDSRHTEFDTMSKFHYQLFLILEEVHNFTHTVQIEDKWFGNYQNGTDGGVGKLLYDDKIDVTCTGASQRPPRVDAYDYLMPSYHFRPCYIFRNPGSYNPLSNEFLKPFSSYTWCIVGLSVVIISVSLKNFHRIESRFTDFKMGYSWTAAFLTTLSVMFQQDASAFPTGYAGRVAFLVLQILSILLYNYYTSSIISSLLSKAPEAFHTLDELGRSSLEIGIENLPYTITWFEIMNDSDVQYIYKHKVFPADAKNLNIYEPDEGIAKIRKGGFAYHTQLDTGYPIIARTFDQDAICDITEIPMIPQVEAGMMVQKKSQYKELFHVTLRRIKEVGLVQRISQIWEAKKPECLSSARVIAVGINQVFMAFFVLFNGIMLSLLFLAVEIFWFKLDLDKKFVRKGRN